MGPALAPVAARPAPHPLRGPVGLAGLAALVLMLVGSIGPWVSGPGPSGATVSLDGFSGAADGAVALLFALLLVLALGSRSVAGSRTRVVQLLPAGLGLVALAYMVVGLRDLPVMTAALEDLGVQASTGAAVWVETGGALLACGAGLAASVSIVRRNPVRHEAAASASAIDRDLVVRSLSWLIGAVAGAGLGVWVAVGQYGSTGSPFVPAYGIGGLIIGLFLAGTILGLFGPSDQRKGG